MNEKDLKILWKIMKEGDPGYPNWTPVPNFPDYPTFKSKMSTPELRNRFYLKNYAALVKGKIFSNDWTADDFEAEYGPQNNTTPPPTTTTKTTPAPTKEEICNGKVVSEGMKGDTVWMIQDKLSRIGLFKKNLTNNFGTETKKAVVNFQNKNKLSVDGKVGPTTWDLLFQGTDNACKKVENKPTEVKPTEVKPEVKPTQVMPNKVRKPIKDLDVVSPEKYSVRIGEQADSLPKANFNFNSIQTPKFNFNNTKYSTPTQTNIENPVEILKRVINTGCIENLKKEIGFELKGNPESQPRTLSGGTVAITGINSSTEEVIRLYSNGKGVRFKVDEDNKPIQGTSEDFEWECADFKESTSRTADNNQMTADQQKFVKDIVAHGRGLYKTQMPSGYDEGQGAWKRTDLSTVEGGKKLFEPNKFFVWAKTGVVGKRQDYVEKVVEFIEGTGYSFDEPDVTSAAFETGVLLGDKFPKYRDYFKPDQKIWYVGKSYSGEEQGQVGSVVDKIKADAGTELKKEFCKGGVDVLYDAAFNPTKVYFKNDADLQLVKDYVKRCVRELRPNAMSNLLGGSRKKFEYLRTQRSGTKGALRYMIGEQKDNLSSLIKKKLVEAKSKKENDTVGKQLIENKLKMIVKSVKRQENILKK